MAEIHRSGFEVTAVTDDGWNLIFGTGQSISTAVARSGTRSLLCSPTADNSVVKKTFTGDAVVVLHAALYFTSFPAGDCWLLRFENVGETGPAVSVKYDSGGTRLVNDVTNGVAQVTSTGPSVSTGTWYRVELLVNWASPWNVQWRVNDTAYSTLTPAYTANTAANLYMGIYGASTAAIHFDDYVLYAGSTADYPPGDIHIIPAQSFYVSRRRASSRSR